jgi:hypothetical protein
MLAVRKPRAGAVCPGNLLESLPCSEGRNRRFKQVARSRRTNEEQVRRTFIGRVPMKRARLSADATMVVVLLSSHQLSSIACPALNVTGQQAAH